MRIKRLILLLAIGAFVAGPMSTADANQNLQLTPEIQSLLMKAETVRGKPVTRELFNGKPVLVTFFASW